MKNYNVLIGWGIIKHMLAKQQRIKKNNNSNNNIRKKEYVCSRHGLSLSPVILNS